MKNKKKMGSNLGKQLPALRKNTLPALTEPHEKTLPAVVKKDKNG